MSNILAITEAYRLITQATIEIRARAVDHPTMQVSLDVILDGDTLLARVLGDSEDEAWGKLRRIALERLQSGLYALCCEPQTGQLCKCRHREGAHWDQHGALRGCNLCGCKELVHETDNATRDA